jgi:two-component system sensor histidine kinase BaeS
VTTGDGGDRERWERRHAHWREHRRARRGGPWPAFGCLFFLVFLLIAGTLVVATATAVSTLGPMPAVVAVVLIVLVLIGIGRTFRRTAVGLDRLVEATRRVEAGDYGVRVGPPPERSLRAVRDLSRGFDTMVERLDADERQRRLLLADVSHELRTPLAVIAGDVEAMIDGVHPADEAHLRAVLDETRVMSRLVDDLRTLSLSEAGTLALHREPTDIDVVLDAVVRSADGAATERGVSLRDASAADTELPILDVDPVRLQEAIGNLVANAIRHTPPGGSVTVTASLADPWLEIRVADTGPGIDPELLPRVFERFVTGAGSGGSGLGLAIARSLVEAHGGTLTVESTGRSGTTFCLRLPSA